MNKYIEKKVFELEVITDTSACTLRDAMRVACLHELAIQGANKSDLCVSEVLFNQAKDIVGQVKDAMKQAGRDYNPAVAKVKYAESLLDAEASIKEESSQFKHLQRLPRAWTNAKSVLKIAIEYEADLVTLPTVSKLKKFNKEEKDRREQADAAGELKEMAAQGVHLEVAQGGQAPAEVEKTTTEQVHVTPVIGAEQAAGLDPEVAAVLQDLAKMAGDMDQKKALTMLRNTQQQMQKSVAAKLAQAS